MRIKQVSSLLDTHISAVDTDKDEIMFIKPFQSETKPVKREKEGNSMGNNNRIHIVK